jgi:hypothetical protein
MPVGDLGDDSGVSYPETTTVAAAPLPERRIPDPTIR